MTTITMKKKNAFAALPAIEILLEDDRRRRRIEPLLSRAPVLLADRESALGLAAGQTLVLKDHRKIRARPKARGERFDTRGHVARRSIEMTWQADHERLEAVLFRGKSGHFGCGAVEGVAVETGRPQHADRARKRAGRIAHRDPDSTLTDI